MDYANNINGSPITYTNCSVSATNKPTNTCLAFTTHVVCFIFRNIVGNGIKGTLQIVCSSKRPSGNGIVFENADTNAFDTWRNCDNCDFFGFSIKRWENIRLQQSCPNLETLLDHVMLHMINDCEPKVKRIPSKHKLTCVLDHDPCDLWFYVEMEKEDTDHKAIESDDLEMKCENVVFVCCIQYSVMLCVGATRNLTEQDIA